MYYSLWILVANRAQARLFRRNKPSEGIEFIQKIDFPEGRLKEREINSDRPGRTFKSADIQRSSYSPDVSATDARAIEFAHHLAKLLDLGRSQNQYERLVLVAAPRMLGLIRNALPSLTLDRVVESWDKDLSYLTESQVVDDLHRRLLDVDRRIGLPGVF